MAWTMARYRRVVLHAGLSKTGSTTLQAACDQHRALLAEQGIRYPAFTFDDLTFSNHSIPVTAALTGSATSFGLRLGERFAGREREVVATCEQQFAECLDAGNADTLLLSTEIAEGYGPRVAADLLARLSGAAHELCVVAYVRNPVSALASLLQERARAGVAVGPESLVGRTQQKCERLARHFGSALTLLNYHDASTHPTGLVGAWFNWLGLDDAASAIEVQPPHNTRLSAEAYRLVAAINERHPLGDKAVPRKPYDLDCLNALPGQRFEVPGFHGSDLEAACLEEAAWLEAHCGLKFPSADRASPAGLLWGEDTLAALPEVLATVDAVALRTALASVLHDEAQLLREERPATASRLEAIAAATQSAA